MEWPEYYPAYATPAIFKDFLFKSLSFFFTSSIFGFCILKSSQGDISIVLLGICTFSSPMSQALERQIKPIYGVHILDSPSTDN